MKKLFISIFFILPSISLFSQNIKFDKKTGIIKKYKMSERALGMQVLGFFDGTYNYLTLPYAAAINNASLKNGYSLEKYDLNLNLINSKHIDLTSFKRHVNELIYFQNKLYLFSTHKNKKEKKLSLYVQTVDKSTFELNEDLRKVADFSYNPDYKWVMLFTSFTVSEDGTKLLIYTHEQLPKPEEITTTSPENRKRIMKKFCNILYVFDENVNLLWEQNITNAVKSGLFIMDKYHIDNSGNVYVTGKNFDNSAEFWTINVFPKSNFFVNQYYTYLPRKSNYKTQIIYFGNSGSLIKQFNLDLPSKFVKNVNIKPVGNTILCSGVYSNNNQYSAKGIFTSSIDINTGNTKQIHTKEFDKEDIKNRLNPEFIKAYKDVAGQNEWDPFDYSLSDIQKTKSGDYIMIAEQQLQGRTNPGASGGIIYPVYLYKDMFVLKFDKTGNIKKMSCIKKIQYSHEKAWQSYSHLLSGDDLYFIYNEISPIKDFLKIANLENSYLVHLNKSSEQKKEALLKDGENKSILFFSEGTIISDIDITFVYPIISPPTSKFRTLEKITIK